MDNLLIILPVFSVMLAGFFLGRTSVFPEGSGAAQTFSTYVWYVAIPALLLKLIGSSTLPESDDLIWIATYYFCLYVIYFLSYFIIAPLVGIKSTGRSVFSFSVCFGNLGFMGIPIVSSLYGDSGVRSLLLIMSFHSITLLLVSSLLAERSVNPKQGFASSLVEIGLQLLKNPIIVTLLFSLIWSATGLGINETVLQIISLPADSAAPVGLFAVGLSLSRVKIKGVRIVAVSAVSIKLIFLPLLVYWVMRDIMHFDAQAVAVATIAACMPTGVIAYNFAQQYQVRVKSSAATILLGSVVSALTLSIALAFLS